MRLFVLTIFGVCLAFQSFAQEAESFEVKANACEKKIAEESPSSTRIRAVDRAVFMGLKNLDYLKEDKQKLNEYDLNRMIYRLLDDFVEDLSSKVVKSTDDKVCVEVTGFINPQKIDMVRAEIMADRSGEGIDDDIVAQIIENTEDNFRFKPQNLESLALVYLKDVEYYNGSKSPKYAQFLKDKMKDNPYYYLTEDEELADYVITPKVLKAKIDALDEKHKRLQMVVSLEISGITDEVVMVSQNRFLLFSAEENNQDIAARLIKKLLEAAAADASRKIEYNEQQNLETKALGRSK